VLATLFVAALVPVLASPPAASSETAAGTVNAEQVCFVVHNPGDPAPRALFGVRYYTAPPTATTRTIVLVHGISPAHEYWDLDPNFSAARNLARAGYQVIAYDRLGYEHSPYRHEHAGRLITLPGGQEMLHEVVGQVHQGSFTAAHYEACDLEHPGPALGPPTPSVIISGNSVGGGMVSGYPGRYHDVDAAIPVGWTNNGTSTQFLAIIGPHVAEAYALGEDYLSLEPTPGECTTVFLHPPGVAEAARDFCRTGAPPGPLGEVSSAPALFALNLAQIPGTGPSIPVLLVFNDHDQPFPTENTAAEFAYWQAACGCDVETWTQADAGHAPTAHRTMPTFTAKLVSWLTSKGLGPR
jgi:pimeloyl-ACP methyl ester carboxylesterase